jgi:NADH:ubiquinone oxidoreductase subunit C
MNNFILITLSFNNNLSIAKNNSTSNSFKINKNSEKFFLDIKNLLGVYLIDHNAVDYPMFKKRFLLYYSFVNYISKIKLFFFSRTVNNTISLSSVYPCAEWLERESFDFFGIFYAGHPDLRRILTDYGFPSYALRKDFPVQGYFDLVYSISNKKIQFKEIEFQQSFRVFLKENPYHTHLIQK